MTELRRLAAVVLVGGLIVACRNKEAPATAAPDTTAAADAGGAAGDPLGAPERALADNAARLRALGIELEDDKRTRRDFEKETAGDDEQHVAEESKPEPKTVESAATRCDELCGLADTACGLRVQICGLAEDHVGESRYEAACWRATDQCTRASTACDDCKGTSAGAAGSCAAG